jgi:hypothetical protein
MGWHEDFEDETFCPERDERDDFWGCEPSDDGEGDGYPPDVDACEDFNDGEFWG